MTGLESSWCWLPRGIYYVAITDVSRWTTSTAELTTELNTNWQASQDMRQPRRDPFSPWTNSTPMPDEGRSDARRWSPNITSRQATGGVEWTWANITYMSSRTVRLMVLAAHFSYMYHYTLSPLLCTMNCYKNVEKTAKTFITLR